MRFVRYTLEGRTGLAVSSGNDFHGLTADQANYPGDLDFLLGQRADLTAVGRSLLNAPLVELNTVSFGPPIKKPSKIICLGFNYAAHAQETGNKISPDFPNIFARFPSTLLGHRENLIKPDQSDQFDYEGELAVIIGWGGRAIPKDQALEHVAGYSIFNDASVRDFQFRTPQWTMGKNFDDTGAFGPWLVTPEDLPPGAKGLAVTTRLNGRVVQSANTDQMILDVPALISLLSEIMTFEAGDVLVTGTPSGVGMSRQPPLFMKQGDICEIEIENLGVLSNPVAVRG